MIDELAVNKVANQLRMAPVTVRTVLEAAEALNNTGNKCDVCGREFKSPRGVTTHKRAKH